MKRWRRWAVLLIAMGMAAFFYGLSGANALRPAAWPPIDDPAALRREAGVLCRGEGGWRELQPGQYPPAVTRLHPASVSVSGERLYVGLVPMPGGARFHGYYVWPTDIDRPGSGIEREESNASPSGL